MDNAKYDTRDVKQCCGNKLGIEFRGGKEYNGWYCLDGKKAARITIPKGRKPVPPGTYKSMASQLKLAVGEFDNLLSCLMTRSAYEAKLRDRTNRVD